MDRIRGILGPQGLLSERLSGYRHRPQQQAMAEAVTAALKAGETLICEAGTGTGKTFAYLVPALLSGRKVLASTGTRNLQDQLFHRDLPLVREVLQVPVRTAMLKGRGNYLCRYRLDAALQDHRRRFVELRRQLLKVRDWAAVTRSGDVAELDLPEDAPVWPAVTSSGDNCLSGPELPGLEPLPPGRGPTPGPGGGSGGHQPPPVMRRPLTVGRGVRRDSSRRGLLHHR